MLHEHAPHPALSKHITTNPPPELGAGPGGPKVGGDPPKSPTSGFRGSEFLPLLVVHDVAHKNWGSNSRMANGVLPPNPKNPKNCVDDLAISGEQIWTKVQIYTLQISGRPP